MSAERVPHHKPFPPGVELLSLAVEALAELPTPERNALLSFLDFWRELPREERALFVKSVRPGMTDREVAALCGVSRRTVFRWDRYRAFKGRLEGCMRTRRARSAFAGAVDGDQDGEEFSDIGCHP